MNYFTKHKLGAGFGLVLVFLVLNGAVSVESTLKLIEIRDRVSCSHEILAELEDTYSTVLDVQNAQRGYIITGNETYLEPNYYNALAEIDAQVARVRELTAENPSQQRRLDAIEALIAERIKYAKDVINVRREEGFEAARKLVLTGQGQIGMDGIRNVVAEMENAEQELLKQRSAEATAATRKTFVTFATANLLTVGLLCLVAFVLNRDLAQRQRAAEALRESEERFRTFMDNSPAVAFMKDEDGRIVFISEAIERRFPMKRHEWIGKTDFDLWPVATAERLRKNDRAVLADGKISEAIETVPEPDGSLRHLLVCRFPVRDAVGRIFLGGMSVEITDRIRAENELRDFASRLEQSNRELQDFAYVASHDLQEPLRKIQAFGDRLKAKCAEGLGDQGRDYLNRMQSAAARMQTLITDLLTFSRVTTKAQPFLPIDLSQTAREVLADLETRIEENDARVEIGELPGIEADPMQMRQLLQNLVGNALKFHRQDESPVVKIRGQVLNAENGSNNSHGSDTTRCQITVEDNGIGFDEKYLDRIFNVFQRLHSRGQYEGTGVGLAVCRKIVERHGGSITARSEPGKGAAFIVTLPLKQSKGELGNGGRRKSDHNPDGR